MTTKSMIWLMLQQQEQRNSQLKRVQRKSQQKLQEKEQRLQELRQAVDTLKNSAQTAVEDSERIFTELILFIEKKRSEVTQLIRAQEKAELSQTGGVLEQLEQEVADLKGRHTQLEQLLHTEDHIHFLQSFKAMCLSSGCEDSPSSTTVNQHLSFDEVRKSLSDLKERFKEFCQKEFCKVKLPELTCKEHPEVAAVPLYVPSEPKTREDFLQYFCPLTLDLNTVHNKLSVSEKNKTVEWRGGAQHYPDHPERFDRWPQVLCKESMSGRCYWEVEWDNGGWGVSISVSYKEISRKGDGVECAFGGNSQSWSLLCSSIHSFWHNNIETKLSAPPSSRIGVYVDHSAGTLSFYSVTDTMTLLHTVHTTFTQPLCAGFWSKRGRLKLCDPDV
ncbi:tripartite motif-containing protein 16-like protein isoform X2 [Salminus brasiliensis]|uniref:tripartite motif-containing protein 16-like protein isoform X2 n=1 Tax=Salminus brasiliensis TaxID=930266 RepID=UPI003B83A560